jgi:hypothetical protein
MEHPPMCAFMKWAIALAAVASLPLMAHGQSGDKPDSATPPSPPIIYSVDPTSGRPGSAVTILGFGFTTNNKVAIGSTSIRHVSIAWAAGINCVRASDTCHPGINQALIINVPTTAAAGR